MKLKEIKCMKCGEVCSFFTSIKQTTPFKYICPNCKTKYQLKTPWMKSILCGVILLFLSLTIGLLYGGEKYGFIFLIPYFILMVVTWLVLELWVHNYIAQKAQFSEIKTKTGEEMQRSESLTKELKSIKRWLALATLSFLPTAILFFVLCYMAIREVTQEEKKTKISYTPQANRLFKANKIKILNVLSNEYIKKYPNYYAPYYFKMLIAVQKKEYNKAIQYLEKIYELNPKAYEQFGPYMTFLKERKNIKTEPDNINNYKPQAGDRVRLTGVFKTTKGYMGIVTEILLPSFCNRDEEALKYKDKWVRVIGTLYSPSYPEGNNVQRGSGLQLELESIEILTNKDVIEEKVEKLSHNKDGGQ